jgi:hypothetical protein
MGLQQGLCGRYHHSNDCGDSRGLVIGAKCQLILQTIDHTSLHELERLTVAAKDSMPDSVLGEGFEYGVAQVRPINECHARRTWND